MSKKIVVSDDPWAGLKKYTDARIALGHSGVSLPTRHHLEFQRDHAAARDAVKREINWPNLREQFMPLVTSVFNLQSQVTDRSEYLQRPDLGRLLNTDSLAVLDQYKKENAEQGSDVLIVVTDGLSAPAIEESAVLMVRALLSEFSDLNLNCSTICCVKYGRVGVGDKVSEALNAQHTIVLVGERPGLSSPNSLGIYYTYGGHSGSNDADRNCISNVRPGGQSIEDASRRLCWLMAEANKLGYSGVNLKDDSLKNSIEKTNTDNFLLNRNVSKPPT